MTHPLLVDHVPDHTRRYPGETVVLQTRVQVLQPLTGYRLTLCLPAGLQIDGNLPPPELANLVPEITLDDKGEQQVLWQAQGPWESPESHVYRLQATVLPVREDTTISTQAIAMTLEQDGSASATAEETASLAIFARGQYLRYLPALYERDELMGRFLMLFESFWAPLEGIVDQLPFYFDPRTAPPDLLPWLASWLDLTLDARWPEEKRRQLLHSAVDLYRKRGTRQGLQEYLELYTGQTPRIIEHRAWNLRLGQARLGVGTALGTDNVPHTFTVVLKLPPITGENPRQVEQQERERRRMIERIVESEKPAHTAHVVRVEPLSD